MHPGQRHAIHAGNLDVKVAEIDPARPPGITMASGDMAAVDIEEPKRLLSYREKNRPPKNPWGTPQIVTALKHGLSCKEGGL